MERYQQRYHALGSEAVLTIVADQSNGVVDRLFDTLHNHIETFEKRFSRFLPESELTQFNMKAGDTVTVSTPFLALLSSAKAMAEATNGIYNPFILPALQQAGYVGSWPQPQLGVAPGTNFSHRRIATIGQLKLGPSWARMPRDAAIDFGGIGKGYLLDELAKLLNHAGVHNYWLSLGGDIICEGYDLDGAEWRVAIQSAIDQTMVADTITNPSGIKLAIATSGTIKRKGVNGGRSWHHLIDTISGESAQTAILTATVTADQAVVADVYAKCVVLAGHQQAQIYQNTNTIRSFLIQQQEDAHLIQSKKG